MPKNKKKHLCPIKNGALTKMTIESFKKLCKQYMMGNIWGLRHAWKPGIGPGHYACAGCKIGKKVKAGKLKKAPSRIEWIILPKRKRIRKTDKPSQDSISKC